IPVKRASPTLTFTDINRVSELLSVPTKDASRDSFPGDHAMKLLIFSAFMCRYFGKVAGLIPLIIFVVFAFPRVMIGAHWFTDIIVGSMTVILIGLRWVLLTPLSDRLITFFDKSLPGKNKHFQNK
ncbi:Kdo(2)-lipid A phosphotransferase, partial [Escherichia coli]